MKKTVKLKELRQKLNLTQSAAAAKIGIDQRQWNRYENGINELPLRYLVAICDAFEVSADWLLELETAEGAGERTIEAIEDFYEDAVSTVRGAEFVADNRENLLDFIYFNLARDKERLLKKYGENQDTL